MAFIANPKQMATFYFRKALLKHSALQCSIDHDDGSELTATHGKLMNHAAELVLPLSARNITLYGIYIEGAKDVDPLVCQVLVRRGDHAN